MRCACIERSKVKVKRLSNALPAWGCMSIWLLRFPGFHSVSRFKSKVLSLATCRRGWDWRTGNQSQRATGRCVGRITRRVEACRTTDARRKRFEATERGRTIIVRRQRWYAMLCANEGRQRDVNGSVDANRVQLRWLRHRYTLQTAFHTAQVYFKREKELET